MSKLKITPEVVKALCPHVTLDLKFQTEYPDFSGNFLEFLELDKISYDDKVWVGVRLLTRTQKVRWAIMCAESVLDIFEQYQPTNTQVRECLDFLKTSESFETVSSEQHAAIMEKRRDAAAAYYANCRAGRGGGLGPLIVVPGNYAYAASVSAADGALYGYGDEFAAHSATNAAAYAVMSANNSEEQRNLNLKFLASMLAD